MGKFGDFLTGLVIGGVAGYVYAMLNAPRPGDETRVMLEERGRELKTRAIDTVQTTKERTNKLYNEGRERVKATVEDTVQRTRGVVGERVGTVQEQGTDVVYQVREQASEKLHEVADKIDPNGPTGRMGGSQSDVSI